MTANELLIEGLRNKYSEFGNREHLLPVVTEISRELSRADAALDRARDGDARTIATYYAEAALHQQKAANLISLLSLLTR